MPNTPSWVTWGATTRPPPLRSWARGVPVLRTAGKPAEPPALPREGALSRCRGAGHSPDRTYPVVAASPSFPAYSLTLQLTYSRSGRFLPLFRAPFAAGLSPGWPGSAYAWPGQTHLANETTLINSERVKVASLPKPSLPPSPRARLPSLLRSWGDVRRSPTRGMSPSPPPATARVLLLSARQAPGKGLATARTDAASSTCIATISPAFLFF